MVEIAIPTTGSIHYETVWKLLKLRENEGVTFQISKNTEGAGANRNLIVKNFLLGDAEYLLMIDDDVVVPNIDIKRLITLDKDVLGLPCPIDMGKGLTLDYYWNVFAAPETITKAFGEGLKKVFAVGMGCAFIKRAVLEKIKNPFAPIRAENDEVVKAEDYAFCERANNAGFEVWVDWESPCGHYKNTNILNFL